MRCTVERASLEGIWVDGARALVADNAVRSVGNDLVVLAGAGIDVQAGIRTPGKPAA